MAVIWLANACKMKLEQNVHKNRIWRFADFSARNNIVRTRGRGTLSYRNQTKDEPNEVFSVGIVCAANLNRHTEFRSFGVRAVRMCMASKSTTWCLLRITTIQPPLTTPYHRRYMATSTTVKLYYLVVPTPTRLMRNFTKIETTIDATNNNKKDSMAFLLSDYIES